MESHRGRDRDGEGDGGTRVVEATEGRGNFVRDQTKTEGVFEGVGGAGAFERAGEEAIRHRPLTEFTRTEPEDASTREKSGVCTTRVCKPSEDVRFSGPSTEALRCCSMVGNPLLVFS